MMFALFYLIGYKNIVFILLALSDLNVCYRILKTYNVYNIVVKCFKTEHYLRSSNIIVEARLLVYFKRILLLFNSFLYTVSTVAVHKVEEEYISTKNYIGGSNILKLVC